MTTTTTEAPALITRIREGEERLKPLGDALTAVLIQNRELRRWEKEAREILDQLMESATTGACYPDLSGIRATEYAGRMASAAAGQSEAMKAVYMVAIALGITEFYRGVSEIDEAIRYVVDGAAEFMFRL
jgi:hypothetical protein